jgi:Zn-finger nucleic acid-binding protein
MNCPACKDVALSMSARDGIEIDFCPTCRGVWLDRGELDKIIERNVAETSQRQQAQPVQAPQQHMPPPARPWGSGDSYKYKRKKSFLEDLFD